MAIQKELNDVAKRIQTRLSKLGVKVSLLDIRPVVEQMVTDIDNPSAEEVNKVVDYFLDNASQLTVINETVEELSTEVDSVDNGDDLAVDEEAMLTARAAIATSTNQETSICIGGETGNIPPTLMGEMETLPQSSELATTTKNELVSSTANSLGVVLNETEIEAIATNVNVSSDDLQDTLEEIKGAIIAFIKHRITTNSQKIDDTLNEIVQVATNGFNSNSQQLTDGLRNINQQLQEQSKDFKSRVKNTLKCFQLPEAS